MKRNNVFRKPLLVICIVIIFSSCGTMGEATRTDIKTGHFPTNRTATLVRSKWVNKDTLKKLLVVPNLDFWYTMGQNLNYFEEVMTYSDFQKNIIAKGLGDSIPSISDQIGLNRAYKFYRPFVVLSALITKENSIGKEFRLTLYDPSKVETIFENKIWVNNLWLRFTDQNTFFPLCNSLLDYLRAQDNLSHKDEPYLY